MTNEERNWIYSVLTNTNLILQEKYDTIIKRFPNYLTNTDEKKVIYAKIEGFFHD
jgi:hypothetical protein